MHTTYLSEMMDDGSISLHMWFMGASCDNNLNNILQYIIKIKKFK